MDVYLFIKTEPGLAGLVMEQIVESGTATRAAVVTGAFDVFARIDDISWDDLADRVLHGVHRIPGVRKTVSAPSISLDQVAAVLPPLPKPFWGKPTRGESRQALVFCKIAAGTAATVAQGLLSRKWVIGATFILGDHDLILQVAGRDYEQLTERIVSEITSMPEITSTRTMLVVRATPHPDDRKGRSR